MSGREAKQTWEDQLRTYRKETAMVADVDVRQQPCLPRQRIQNPVTHEFYDKELGRIYNENKAKYEIQALNIARDRQLKQQSSFDFIQQKEHYPQPDVADTRRPKNYEFTQPHIKPKGYQQPVPKVREQKQTRSDDVRQSFQNYTDASLPLFAGKGRDIPVFGGKHVVPQLNNFELGYDERQTGSKNISKVSSKRIYPEQLQSHFDMGYKDM